MSKSNMKELKTNKILNTSNFDTRDCSVGVIHIGVGNFHRAHQALYFNKILNDKNSSNWGIAGINLRSQDRKLIEDLNKSENQYILKTVSAGGEVIYEEIKSILALYDWKDSEDKIQKLFTSNNVQLITITVTESGYYFDKNENLKLFTKDIKSDLSGKVPVTVFGALARGLKARMDANGKPITVASCDNIQENGIMLKKCFFQFLHALNDEKLLKWVKKNVSFPSSMVDRITPKISKNELNKIQETFNRSEDCSVISEDFIQWVIEDNFAGKKPPLDLVGVEIVEDVEPYENTKIKILNGGHIALAYLGVLYGYKTYDAAIRNEALSVFFDSIQSKEIIPSLPNKSPINYKEY